jgi:hypothetical protein
MRTNELCGRMGILDELLGGHVYIGNEQRKRHD